MQLQKNLGVDLTCEPEVSHYDNTAKPTLSYPSQLDSKQLELGTVLANELKKGGFPSQTYPGLEFMVKNRLSATQINKSHINALFALLPSPLVLDSDLVLDLILCDMEHNKSAFGKRHIHYKLTDEQLRKLASRSERVAHSEIYVHAIVQRMRPERLVVNGRLPDSSASPLSTSAREVADADTEAERKLRADYYQQVWTYATTELSPVFSHLKVSFMHNVLAFQVSRGVYDFDKFSVYLQLPWHQQRCYPHVCGKKEGLVDCQRGLSNSAFGAVRSDRQLIDAFLLKWFSDPANTTTVQWQGVIDLAYLEYHLASTKLTLYAKTATDAENHAYIALLKEAHATIARSNGASGLLSFEQLMGKVELRWDTANTTQFRAQDSVKLKLWTQNVSSVVLKLFTINAAGYYKSKLAEVSSAINLDGLVAKKEWKVEFPGASSSGSGMGASSLQRELQEIELPSLDNLCGVFVCEVIGNGLRNRALIRKGQLNCVSENTASGHVLRVVDMETHQPVDQASVWLSGHTYTSDEKTGLITIPYTSSSSPKTSKMLLHAGSGTVDASFTSLVDFTHCAESYSFEAGLYVDREALLQKTKAELVVRPRLSLHGKPVSFQQQTYLGPLIKSCKLTITSTNNDGTDSTQQIDNLELHDNMETIHVFKVPDNLRCISFDLSVTVRKVSVSSSATQVFSASRSFEINSMNETACISDLHLRQGTDGYSLYYLGKAGEAKPNQHVKLSLTHSVGSELSFDLQTSDTGCVHLGHLKGIDALTALVPNTVERKWPLTKSQRSLQHRVFCVAEGQDVHLPYDGKGDFRLYSHREDETFIADLTSAHVNLVDTAVQRSLVLTGLAAGSYKLIVKSGKVLSSVANCCQIHVVSGSEIKLQNSSFVIDTGRYLETTPVVANAARGVQIVSAGRAAGTGAGALKIQLANVSDNTRVHVVASHFAPAFDVFETFGVSTEAQLRQDNFSQLASHYQTQAQLGDEHRYIIARKDASKYVGNMLLRPSLLLNKSARRDTSFSEDPVLLQSMDYSDRSRARMARAPQSPCVEGRSGMERCNILGGLPSFTRNLEFLASPSTRLWNLQPDANGVVSIPASDVGQGHSQLSVVVVKDDHSLACLRVPWTASDDGDADVSVASADGKQLSLNKAYRDTRLSPGLRSDRHLTEQYLISMLQGGDELKIQDIKTATVEHYESMDDVYALLRTLSAGASKQQADLLEKFSFVLKWPSLTEEEKASKYNEFACHELHFFLFHKDPAFFQEVIHPFLLNKMQKSFMDLWLLSRHYAQQSSGDHCPFIAELRTFTAPVAFGRLHALEKVLLGLAVPEKLPAITRFMQHDAQLHPLEPQRYVALFKSALSSRALSGDDDRSLLPAPERKTARADFAAAEEEEDDEAPATFASFGAFGCAAPRAMKMTKKCAAPRKGRMAKRGVRSRGGSPPRRTFQAPTTTKEYEERGYYALKADDPSVGLVPCNSFWADYSVHVSSSTSSLSSFISKHVMEATSSFTEVMCALSVLGLPFAASEHTVSGLRAGDFSFTAGSPVILFHKEIKESKVVPSSIQVSQNYFDPEDNFTTVGVGSAAEQVDKYIESEFLRGRVYGCRVVLTNVSSVEQKVEVLLEIPAGAMPVGGTGSAEKGFSTNTIFKTVRSFGTEVVEYYFYFPALGSYAHYPVHVSKMNGVIGFGVASQVSVVDVSSSPPDLTSWKYLANHATDEQVLAYLSKDTVNIRKLDMEAVAWRCKKEAFFTQMMDILDDNMQMSGDHFELLQFAFVHHSTTQGKKALASLLSHDKGIVRKAGPYLMSDLLQVDHASSQSKVYQHLEYHPLINARAHRLPSEGGAQGGLSAANIQNRQFREHYEKFLNYFLYRSPSLSVACEQTPCLVLQLAYYLLLQERVDEAQAIFNKIDRSVLKASLTDTAAASPELSSSSSLANDHVLQYDYMQAYLDFFSVGGPTVALEIAERYLSYPVTSKRKLFQEIIRHWQESQALVSSPVAVPGDAADRDCAMGELASSEPSLDFSVENNVITIAAQNLSSLQCTVNVYEMDLELMFSNNPFIKSNDPKFLFVAPNHSFSVPLSAATAVTKADVPAAFRNSNVYLEVCDPSAGLSRCKTHYAHSLYVQVMDNYGQVKVTEKSSLRPLPRTYIKVYAKMRDGTTDFYKDGYTDLRGCFDYASLSTNKLQQVARFALLVQTETSGAVVKEAAKPQ